MKKNLATLILFFLSTTFLYSQNLTQTVRGVITDNDSQLPLIGASVLILGTEPLVGTVTDERGQFRLEAIPIGRIDLQISYLAYETKTISNVIVSSGKEVVLNLSMEESVAMMNEIVVTANKEKGKAINDMAMISARSISPEQTNLYAGGFNDPSRIWQLFGQFGLWKRICSIGEKEQSNAWNQWNSVFGWRQKDYTTTQR